MEPIPDMGETGFSVQYGQANVFKVMRVTDDKIDG